MFEVGGVVEQVDAWLGGDFSSLPAEDQFDVMEQVAAVHSKLELFLARGLRQLDTSGLADEYKGLSAAGWLARESMLPRAMTSRLVRAGRELSAWFSVSEQAVLDGRWTMHHVKFLASVANSRVVDRLAEVEQQLIDLAEGISFEQWCGGVRVIVDTLDEDGAHDPNADVDRNRMSVSKLLNGLVKIDLELVGEHGLIFEHAVNQRADDLFKRFTHDSETAGGAIAVPPRTTLMALAVFELVREGLAVDLDSTKAPATELTLVATADDPSCVCDEHGHQLPDGSTVTVRCDAVVWGVIVNTLGVPLDLGRKKRLATKEQRRAMALRDGGCTFPGCSAPPSWTDAHHVLEWLLLLGETDLANLCSLCRRHHGVAHRKGRTLHATDDGWFWWTTPHGETFWSQRHGRQRTDPTPAGPPSTLAA